MDAALILCSASSYINPKVISIFSCHPGWPPDQLNIDGAAILISISLSQSRLGHQFSLSNKKFNRHIFGVLRFMKHFQIHWLLILIIGVKQYGKVQRRKWESQVIKVNITNGCHITGPCYGVTGRAHHSPQTYNLGLIMRKWRLVNIEDILQDLWPLLFESVKTIKDKERARTCHRPEERWHLNATWYPGLETGTEKGHQWKNWTIQMKSVV